MSMTGIGLHSLSKCSTLGTYETKHACFRISSCVSKEGDQVSKLRRQKVHIVGPLLCDPPRKRSNSLINLTAMASGTELCWLHEIMNRKRRHTFLYANGLSIVIGVMLLMSFVGQILTGWNEKNNKLVEEGRPQLSVIAYLQSGHFIQATFENWESEFLQMGLYVLLTISLRQKGSAESKPLDGEEEVDREPVARKNAPWPVRRGGVWLKLYSNSLSLAFVFLFAISFVLHLYGSLRDENEERMAKGESPITVGEHIAGSRFWFESFQNWQSEFLAVGSIVVLSIWLRQKGSPESKPVDAPYDQTGE